MAKKHGNGGAVFLWVVMVAALGVAGTEFFGPTRGWLKPAINSGRQKITGFKDDYEAKQERKRLAAREAAAQAAKEFEGGNTEVSPIRSLADGKGFTIRSSMNDDALQHVQTDGEVTPADLMMLTAAVSEKSLTASVVDRYAKKDLIPGSEIYKSAYTELFEKKLAELTKPEVGKTYTLLKKDKNRFEGRLLVLTRNSAVFKGAEENDISVTSKDLSTRSLKIVFPELYARKYAEYHLAKASGISTPPAAATPASTIKDPLPPHGDDEKQPPTIIAKLPSLKEYDPSYAITPKHLGAPTKEFHNWLDYQNRRLKWRLAKKLYAKQHGKHVVLYFETTKSYRMQSRDVRKVYGEQFWHMWARKLREQGKVHDEKFAHLVLIDDQGIIIGGSQVKDSKKIWVK